MENICAEWAVKNKSETIAMLPAAELTRLRAPQAGLRDAPVFADGINRLSLIGGVWQTGHVVEEVDRRIRANSPGQHSCDVREEA